jgi:phosphatidylglycerophosphatase A
MKQQYRLLPWKVITSGFGLGYVPFAPGTMGSLGALIPAVIILRFSSQPYVIISALFFVFAILGIIGAGKLRHILGKDPPEIVVDEMAGMWVSLLWIGSDWIRISLAFLLFRMFDIFKPLGIRKAESLPGGFGVMADDVLAGIYTNLLIQGFNLILAVTL